MPSARVGRTQSPNANATRAPRVGATHSSTMPARARGPHTTVDHRLARWPGYRSGNDGDSCKRSNKQGTPAPARDSPTSAGALPTTGGARDPDFAKAWDNALRRHSDKQTLKAYQLGLPGSTKALLAMFQRAQGEARASLEACAEATLKVPG